MTFEEYLLGKKIDPALFQVGEPLRWQEFKEMFEQMHPESFTVQKKFLLNDLRRRYPLKINQEKPIQATVTAESVPTESAKPARPAIKRPAGVIRKPPAGEG